MTIEIGGVLDHVLSKMCQSCALKKSKCQDDNDFDNEQWRIEHEAPNECDINFDGSSPAMEAEGPAILWERGRHKRRYRSMVWDRDSKARSSVEDGGDSKVEKLDCVGHVEDRQTLPQFEGYTKAWKDSW